MFILMVCMGGFGSYGGCGWICNGCMDSVCWLEWCLVVWMCCRMNGRCCRSELE